MKPTRDSLRRVFRLRCPDQTDAEIEHVTDRALAEPDYYQAHDLALMIDRAVADAVRGMFRLVHTRNEPPRELYRLALYHFGRSLLGTREQISPVIDEIVAAVQAARDKPV